LDGEQGLRREERALGKPETHYPEATADEVATRMRIGEPMVLLDVRTASEYGAYHIPGAVHIPIDELAVRYTELDAEAPTVVICEHGIRSAIATHFLRQFGFEGCSNMRHGMSEWRGPVEGMMSYMPEGRRWALISDPSDPPNA
jgi:rhodanese-related sulfurtransferase